MPQKKNPYALAAIRTQAGQAAGDLAAALATLHTGSARTDHFHLLNGTVPRALDEAVAIARLTASVLDGIELRPERFEQIARESFVTAADVADVLALEGELDYRSAHKVVGRAVRDLVEAGEPPSALTPARLAAAAEAVIGRPVELDEATLRDALDPGGVRRRPPADRARRRRRRWTRCSTGSTRRSRARVAGARPHGSGRRPPRRRCSRAPASSPDRRPARPPPVLDTAAAAR